jgi:hypothetical protein
VVGKVWGWVCYQHLRAAPNLVTCPINGFTTCNDRVNSYSSHKKKWWALTKM